MPNPFPAPLATALFSFLYHLASYEAGGEALVSCGMMESLISVVNWKGTEPDHITVSVSNQVLFLEANNVFFKDVQILLSTQVSI